MNWLRWWILESGVGSGQVLLDAAGRLTTKEEVEWMEEKTEQKKVLDSDSESSLSMRACCRSPGPHHQSTAMHCEMVLIAIARTQR
jgi:hypothetical protein